MFHWNAYTIAPAYKKIQLPISETQPFKNERVKGIEPSSIAWEATVLPLYYTRIIECFADCFSNVFRAFGAGVLPLY